MTIGKLEGQEAYDFLKQNDLILFEGIIGSQAYGLATPESDIDKKFVYILPEDDILGFDLPDFVEVNKDYVGYEIKKFISLLCVVNPTVQELLWLPEDCVLHCDTAFRTLISHKESFLSKQCLDSFGGYAFQQIKKARGLGKKANWEKEKIEKRGILDFCYITNEKGGSTPLTELLKSIQALHGFGGDQKQYGLVKVPHMRDMYAVYLDTTGTLGYRGIVKDPETSKDVQLSSIPKGEVPVFHMQCNLDGYSVFCKDWKSYQTWLKERNTNRYITNQDHGQTIDSKNIMHCVRLIQTVKEIALDGTLEVRRQNRNELLAIKKGEVNLLEIVDNMEREIPLLSDLFKQSKLPDVVDRELANKLLIQIRKTKYGRNN